MPQMYSSVPPQQVLLQHQQIQRQHHAPGSGPVMHNNIHFVRHGQFGQPSLVPTLPVTPVDTVWANTAESPISAYMRYLQNSIVDAPKPPQHPQQPPPSSQQPPQQPPHPHQQMQQHFNGHSLPGILPNPPMQPFPSPKRMAILPYYHLQPLDIFFHPQTGT